MDAAVRGERSSQYTCRCADCRSIRVGSSRESRRFGGSPCAAWSASLSGSGTLRARCGAQAGLDVSREPAPVRRFGFRILEEREPAEIVIGLEGRFWTLAGGVRHHDRTEFLKPIPQGVVRAMWNFSLSPIGPSACAVTTETRVHWSDQNAGRSFLRYWRFIRPWSGLTRKIMLRAIKRAAEGSGGVSEAANAADN